MFLGLSLSFPIQAEKTATHGSWRDFALGMSRLPEGTTVDRMDGLFDTLLAARIAPGNDDDDVILWVFHLGRIHCDNRSWERCEHLYVNGFRWLEKIHGSQEMILVEPLVELASLWFARSEDARAVQAILRGMHIIERHHGSDHLFQAPLHERLAAIYRHMGKETLARRHEQRRLELWRKAVVPDGLAAGLLPRTGPPMDDPKEKTIAAGILELLAKTPQERHELKARLIRMRIRHSDTLSPEEKIASLTTALSLLEQSKGKNHPGLVPVLMELAILQQNSGMIGEAKGLIHRSLSLVSEFFGPDHPGIARIQLLLGENQRLEGRMEEAIATFEQAIAALRRLSPPPAEPLAAALMDLAHLHATTGRIDLEEQTRMEYLVLLAANKETPPMQLALARQRHKETVARLPREAGEEKPLQSLNFPTLMKRVQRRLASRGLYPGPADGFLGRPSFTAIRAFEKRIGLTESPKINTKTLIRILEHLPP
ncbi:MAG: tetratricopeptide repeat protein [Magnetococcales bacterium]|nr:tetratricopeptide repeat protein [Magnetococcales bacterium]